MNNVQLKVNVINQLKLLRQSTFKDVLCFLDEDIQNAQRAKSTEVRVSAEYYNHKIIIENNGQILNNPQSLFSIAESDWDDDIKSTENPFGMGFFSNITVSNLIEIHSGNTRVIFDVDRMINSGNTEIKVETIEDYYEGFKLVLNNFDFNTISTNKIKDRVENLGKYIQDIDVYYNDELQEHKDLTEGDNSPYQLSIDEDTLKGWISLGSNYDWGNNVSIFYKGRFVSKLEYVPYLKGDLHISDKILNLTSPDRKNIINDDKLREFRSLIKSYAERLCNDTMIKCTEDDLNEYTNCLDEYINKTHIKDLIKFRTFDMTRDTDLNYIRGIALAKSDHDNISNFNEYERYLNKLSGTQSESHFDNIDIVVAHDNPNPTTTVITTGNYYPRTTKLSNDNLRKIQGEILLKSNDPVFYLSFSDISKYDYALDIANHYGLKIIVARNRVEESLLRSMTDYHIYHISDLNQEVLINGNLTNTELSVKEQRALMILDMISRIVGFDHNVFAIGDLIVYKKLTIDSLNIEQDIIDPDIVVLKNTDSNKVYVDRSIINQSNLRDDIDESLDLDDYKFILANLGLIIKELQLIKYDENYMTKLLKSLSV